MLKREIFENRLKERIDELREIYMYLYDDEEMFQSLCENMRYFYEQRPQQLRESDREKEKNRDWYKKNDMIGMMLYIDNFAKDLDGVSEKISYFEKANINYIHLMPFLDSPQESDGGYAVSDFRKVNEKFGTIKDLVNLTEKCHEKGISVSMDFVMNHTSDEHEWAKKARAGLPEYQDRYYFFDNYSMPALYERTVPQVFPTTAPGNFTWLRELQSYVMTTFYPYQWDLNYKNPIVFNEMMSNFLYLANCGIDIMRIDAVPYIWKEINTPCRNLPQVHMLVRMMRIIDEIVCPSVLLLGEVVMEPEKVVPYFGTVEKPECHMLYNVTTMATTWNTVATRDTRLLRNQLDFISRLPKDFVFLNYLRCHDDIGWGLDYNTLRSWGMQEISHKQYLNDFFTGKVEGSFSRAELYNESLYFNDARVCATTASMCGIEKALGENDKEKLDMAIQLDTMLHAFMFMQSGIPVVYSGDEIGQLNDYSYKKDAKKKRDSRWVHRGKMDWQAVDKIDDVTTVQGRVFKNLQKLEEIRKREKVYASNSKCYTVSTWDDSLLCIVREDEKDKIIGLFNFSEEKKIAWIDEQDDLYRDIYTDEVVRASALTLDAYQFLLLKRMNLAKPKSKAVIAQKPKGLKAGPPKGVKPKMWKPPVYEPKKKEEKEKENIKGKKDKEDISKKRKK
ncbi:MAG: alpha-amylase family protein [Lachnospiraceae bacterium]